MEKYYKTKDAADFLSVSNGTMRNWRYFCTGPKYVKIGRLVRYKLTALIDFMEGKK